MSQERIATRDSYGKALLELAEEREDIIVLDADLAGATKTGVFKKSHPERFIDCGIAECDMMGIAAGLASTGQTVFASSFAMFAAGRAYEVVRNSIGYPHLPVKICATHAGISVGEDGASHQCCEDIALMRVIPGMTVINPSDDIETRAAIHALADYDGPAYVRLGRLAVPVFNTNEDYRFEIGKGIELKPGNDVTVLATGLMVSPALEAAEILKEERIDVRVINIHTIKPLDREIVLKAARETGLLVTAEEHSVIGGFGSAVSELCAEEYPVRVIKIGVNDCFGMSGPALELLDKFGLNAQNIVRTVRRAVQEKK